MCVADGGLVRQRGVMGNSGSQAAGAGQQPPRRGWAHSYPRPVHKVLPERVPGQRLRLTTNGNILHSGGTLTGRKYSDHQVNHVDLCPLIPR